jgi:hypothetical protein
MKKFLAVITLISLALTFAPIASGDVPDENFYPSVKQEAGWMGYNSDNSIEYSQPSSLYAQSELTYAESVKQMYVCDSLQAKDCATSEINGYTFNSIFTKCQSDSDTDCIDSFSIKNEENTMVVDGLGGKKIRNSLLSISRCD